MILKIGFATEDITPAAGKVIPGGHEPRVSKGIFDALQVRACFLRGRDRSVAVAGVDAVSLSFETVERARAQIAAERDIPAENIIIAASHAHCCGPANDVLGSDSDPEYLDFLVCQIKKAVISAHDCMQDAEIACGTGGCDGISFNRRFKMRDGTEKSIPRKCDPDIVAPAGSSDSELGIIAFRSKDGALLGAIANFTCHPTVVWGDLFSGDYPSFWQKALHRKIDQRFTLVFLNGACGDVGPTDYTNADSKEYGVDWAGKMGETLADETIRVIEKTSFLECDDIVVLRSEVKLKYRRPGSDELEKAKALVSSDAPWNSQKWMARDLVLLAEQLDGRTEVACPLTVVGIGPATIVAAPWQPFCEFGLRIKAESGGAVTLVAAFANGMLGYVPTEQAFIGGGYEPTLCRGSKLHPESGAIITNGLVRMAQELRG